MKKIISIILVTLMLVSSLIALNSCSDENGKNGTTPTIGENGNWWIGDTDTGIKAQGDKGEKGNAGADGEDGIPGEDGEDGKNAATPTFKYNGTTKHYEVSFDGGATWTQIENYDPRV